jgi:hypothetical protein
MRKCLAAGSVEFRRPALAVAGYYSLMSKLLFDLRNVPDDEADEVRAMLDGHGIAYYETAPSAWGLFAGGIWITDEAELADAKALFADYQQRRQSIARENYDAARRDGNVDSFWTTLRRQPARTALWLLTIAFLLGLTVLPFILLGK